MEVSSRFVDAGGIRTHYLHVGTGTPVILIHGGGAGADAYGNWSGVIPEFAKHHEVFAMDMIGFGKTDKPDPESFTYSTQARVDHLIAFIDALGLKSVSLVGNSMGGSASLGVGMQRPELLDRLVLMGSAGLSRYENNGGPRPLTSYDTPDKEAMRKLVKHLTYSYEPSEELLEYRVKLTSDPATLAAYRATMQWIVDQGGLFYEDEDIARVKAPTLIVNGKNDKVNQVWKAIKFSELIERSWLFLIPDCGHWAMIEQPDDFNAATLHFLQKKL
ncbi:MAG: alpha/beta hydrolase [Aquisalimonadaceae bacterium]